MSEKQTGAAALELPKSPQDAQFGEWMAEVTKAIGRFGTQFSELPVELQKKMAATLNEEVAKVTDRVEDLASFTRRRFQALAGHYAAGGEYGGPGSREQAEACGALAVLAARKDIAEEHVAAAKKIIERAAFDPSSGAKGGLIMPETIFAGIANRLPEYGVYEADNPPQPCFQNGKLFTWTDGFVVYHPDINEAPTLTESSLGAITPNLTRYSIATCYDRWMAAEPLLVALGQLIMEGMSRVLSKTQDLYGLHGEGTAAHARVTGIFGWRLSDTDYVVEGDATHDTYAEMLDFPHKYLLDAIGRMPAEFDDGSAKWYGHRTIFFRALAARDANDKPVAEVSLLDPVNRFVLFGYPYRFSPQGPKMSDASQADKVFLAFANLRAAHVFARHPTGIELRRSEEYKFLEGMITLVLDVLQDIVPIVKNRGAAVQVKTHA